VALENASKFTASVGFDGALITDPPSECDVCGLDRPVIV
jgi:hypothetical protein